MSDLFSDPAARPVPGELTAAVIVEAVDWSFSSIAESNPQNSFTRGSVYHEIAVRTDN